MKHKILIIDNNTWNIADNVFCFYRDKRVKHIKCNTLETLGKTSIEIEKIIISMDYHRKIESGYVIDFDIIVSSKKLKELDMSQYNFIIIGSDVNETNMEDVLKEVISSGFSKPIIASTDCFLKDKELSKFGATRLKNIKISGTFIDFIKDYSEFQIKESA